MFVPFRPHKNSRDGQGPPAYVCPGSLWLNANGVSMIKIGIDISFFILYDTLFLSSVLYILVKIKKKLVGELAGKGERLIRDYS